MYFGEKSGVKKKGGGFFARGGGGGGRFCVCVLTLEIIIAAREL